MNVRPKLIALRGLPASGKSTWAKAWADEDPERRFRINRDDLRGMGHQSRHITAEKGQPGTGTERIIVAARDAAILALLRAKVSVVVDDTNLTDRHIRELYRLAVFGGADFEIRAFDTPWELCVERNAARAGRACVPDGKMQEMRELVGGRDLSVMPSLTAAAADEVLPYTVPDQVDHSEYLRDVYLVDIDGTVALHGDRSPYDMTRVSEDTPNEAVIEVLEGLDYAGHRMIFMSGRDTTCRADTEAWLKQHVGVTPLALHMRAAGDTRPDSVVKTELFNKYVRTGPYRVLGVFDDRHAVVQMWRSMGLTVFQVAEGDF